MRGQWGELQLRRVLESAGLVEGSHYEIKESVHGDEGRLTPDVIVGPEARARLKAELNVEPSAETVRLAEAIRAGRLRAARAVDSPSRP